LYGADALRLYLVNSPVVRAEPLRFQKEGVFAVVKDLFLKWYNAYRFLVQSVQRFEADSLPAGERWTADRTPPGGSNVLDRWIVAACHALVALVRAEMAAYRLYTVTPALVRFIEALCNTYVRLNRGRLKGRGGVAEAEAALATLYSVLLTTCTLMAPFTPFLTESMFQNLRRAAPAAAPLPASVHFCPMPQPQPAAPADQRIVRSVQRMATVIELARVIRERHSRGVKTPLRRLTVVHPDQDFLADLSGELAAYVTEEVNVQSLTCTDDVAAHANVRCEPNWAALGKRLGKSMGAVAAALKALSPAAIAQFEAEGRMQAGGVELAAGDVTVVREFKPPAGGEAVDAAGDGDVLVILTLDVDEELAGAGLAREAAARVQKGRKAAGLSAGDAVCVALGTQDEALLAALRAGMEALSGTLGAAPTVGYGAGRLAAPAGAQELHYEAAELAGGQALQILLYR